MSATVVTPPPVSQEDAERLREAFHRRWRQIVVPEPRIITFPEWQLAVSAYALIRRTQ